MKRIPYILVLIAALALSSCSVKEDRSKYPSWLTVEMDRISEDFKSMDMRLYRDGKVEFFDKDIDVDRYRTEPYEYMITERGILDAVFFRGDDDLYAGHVEVRATEDEPHVKAELHKQFSDFTVIWDATVTSSNYGSFNITASYNAFDLRSFAPVGGGFSTLLDRVEGYSNRFVTRIPRQKKDTEILLNYVAPSGLGWHLDLRNTLAELGFDWDKEDLDDVLISTDGFMIVIKIADMDSDTEVIEYIYGNP